jgi:hypothetical protein
MICDLFARTTMLQHSFCRVRTGFVAGTGGCSNSPNRVEAR